MISAALPPLHAKLSLREKVAYGFGSAAFSIKDHGFTAFLMIFYNQIIGLPVAWVGGAIMAVMVVDGLADPLIGYYSDNLRTRWGRRHPMMVAAALPSALFYILLWSPPEGSHMVQMIYLVLIAVGVRLSVSLFEIPNTALMSELSGDYDERTSLSAARALWAAIALISMAVIGFKLLGQSDDHLAIEKMNSSTFGLYSYIAASIMFVAILVSSWGTRKRIPALLAMNSGTEHPSIGALFQGIRDILRDRSYSSVIGCSFFFAVCAGVNTALAVYVYAYLWKLSPGQIGALNMAYIPGLIAAFWVASLAKKFGKKAITVSMLLLVVVACCTPQVLYLVGLVQPGSPALMPVLAAQLALVGMCVVVVTIIGVSMIADVTEDVQLHTGKRLEGVMFSAQIMINKAVSGIGIFLAGIILSAIHFPEKAVVGQVDAGVLYSLSLVYVGFIVVFCLLSAWALSFYTITRESHAETVAKIKQQALNS